MLSVSVLLAASVVVGQAAEPNVPKEVLESMAYYLGNWKGEYTEDGQKCSLQFTAKWVPGKHCTLLTSRAKTPGGMVQETLLSGWNSSAKQIVDCCYRSDGSHSIERWTIVSPTVEEAESTGSTDDGRPTKANYRIVKKDNDRWTLSITDRKVGEQSKPDLVIEYTKVQDPDTPVNKNPR